MAAVKKHLARRKFDVVIVGAGGRHARLAATGRAGLNVAVLSKVFPTRSHTVAAQGGIGALAGQHERGQLALPLLRHRQGLDWLGDQDAIEFMCREAPKVVYELEHFGMPFDRNEDGTIYQRPFWRPHRQLRRKPVQRACAAADRTGHADAAHAVPAERQGAHQFFVEWMALDLIRDADGDVLGVTALEMETGEVYILQAKARCSPPAARAHLSPRPPTPSSTPATAWAWRLRAGHPAARTWSSGSSTHRRGRRGRAADRGLPRRGRDPAQRNGERFMERYAPTLKDLAAARLRLALHGPGDQGGPGCGPNKDYIHPT